MRGCSLPARRLSRLPELLATSPRRPLRCCCAAPPAASLVARWSVDAKYGSKRAALLLLQEWLAGPAASAGLAADRARLLACTIGGTESRCELELAFDSLSELESFWASLPPKEHSEWQLRFAACVVDASPSWTVLRVMEVGPETPQPAAKEASALLPAVRRSASGLYLPEAQAPPALPVALDWKGDPISYNPGDKMPRII